MARAHLDEVLEARRFLQADVVRFAHDPEANRNQIRSECLRQIVFRARQILDQGRPQLAQEQQGLDSFARLRPALIRQPQQADAVLQRLALALPRRLRRILQNLRI